MNKKIKDTILCASFCGTGKSYLCDKFPNTYKEIECWEYRTGNFPNNYIQDVISMVGKTKYLFISTDPIILQGLNKLGFKIHLVYPENKLRSEYLDRYIDRNNHQDFIGAIMKNWYGWINELKEQNYCTHTVLQQGEYLQDIFIKKEDPTHIDIAKLKVGDKVCYQPEHYSEGKWENGIIKEILVDRNSIRVVYNCGGEWDRFKEYTSALTNLRDLKLGWKYDSNVH